ncbi:hypothetical protein Tco_0551941 [Tanacetum coccineum]
MIEEEDESDTELEDITEAEKKFKMLANDEEMAKKVQKKWEAEEEKKRLVEEEATKAAFTNEYDFIQARLNADKILAEKSSPSKRELSCFMIPLLHKGDFLLNKDLRSDENFIAIGSVEDERLIKDLNKKAAGIKKPNSIKEECKEKEAPDEDKEVDYEILNKKYPIVEWKSEYLGIKPQHDETKDLEEINLNVVIRSNGQRRYFSTLMRMLSIFDREDLSAVYRLVMDRYQDEIPEGFDRVLWGNLMIMFNPSDEDKFWKSQQDWNVVSWKLHGSSGLESEEDSTMAFELIRFVKKLLVELEPKNSDGDEEDL